jgi:hypothetical protein
MTRKNKKMKEIINLRYDMYSSPEGHPQTVMKELKINYQMAIPQSIADQWWFLNCENIPDPLPKYLKPLNNYKTNEPIKFNEMIGHGLDEHDVIELTRYRENHFLNNREV